MRVSLSLAALAFVSGCSVTKPTPVPPVQSFSDVRVRVTNSRTGEPMAEIRVCALGVFPTYTSACLPLPALGNWCGDGEATRKLQVETTDDQGLVTLNLSEPNNYVIGVDAPAGFRAKAPYSDGRLSLNEGYRDGETLDWRLLPLPRLQPGMRWDEVDECEDRWRATDPAS